MKKNQSYIEGAKKLLFESLQAARGDKIVILSTISMMEFSEYLFEAARQMSKKDLCYLILPNEFRPMENIPEIFVDIVRKADSLIHITDRMAAEDFTFIRPIRSICEKEKCRYLYLYDAKLNYLGEGINASYRIVNDKCKRLSELLRKRRKVFVSSRIGTNLSFELYDTVIPRSPIFGKKQYSNQAPEGEVMACPIEMSFEGKMVVDGPVTGMGKTRDPIIWEFEKGKVARVKGNRSELDHLMRILKASDSRVRSLEGITIAEFAMGTNDWSKVDENISNCEKVSGTVHFGMGKTVGGIGEDRGEKYHFDSMLIDHVSVEIKNKSGQLIKLVESGKLLL